MDLSNQRRKKRVYKLKKRLCELKQAPRTWYKRVNIYLWWKGIIWNNLDIIIIFSMTMEKNQTHLMFR